MERNKGLRQAADLIGAAVESPGFLNEPKTPRVLSDALPTEEETEKFNTLVKSKIIYKSDYGLMIMVNENISTNINLKNGCYALGQRKLDDSMLYLARHFNGWEDPTGSVLPPEVYKSS